MKIEERISTHLQSVGGQLDRPVQSIATVQSASVRRVRRARVVRFLAYVALWMVPLTAIALLVQRIT